MIKDTQKDMAAAGSFSRLSEQEQLYTGLNKVCTSAGVDKFNNKLAPTSKHQASGRWHTTSFLPWETTINRCHLQNFVAGGNLASGIFAPPPPPVHSYNKPSL